VSRRPLLRLGRAHDTPKVLIVSPSVTPPWTNGTSVLVRYLCEAGLGFRYHVMGCRGQVAPGARVTVEPIYGDGRQHPLVTQARLAARLLMPDGSALHHFFFAPHPRAVRVAKIALTLSRRRSVHTVPSPPADDLDLRQAIFADRTVVLTEASAVSFRQAGVSDVHVIRPAVPLPPDPADPTAFRRRLALWFRGPRWGDEPAFLYPGDLEFSDGASVFLDAAELVFAERPDARFILACRPKTPRAAHVLADLERRVARSPMRDRVTFVGVAPDFTALLGAVTAVVLPVSTLYAKVDTPLALLNAMALGVPAIVSDIPQLAELAGLGDGVRAVRRSDPEDTAKVMLNLAAHSTLQRTLGEGARRTVASHFAPSTMAAAYEALYRELIDA
jgi:glycosyltransferase involved in cell wall biosynthesis